jgi:hypothetical protein
MEGSIKSMMESALGADFSEVKVHTGAKGAEIAKDNDAKALAVGQHIAFGEGEYQPGTLAGDALLAHELAHTQQQKGADITQAQEQGPESAYEEEADEMAEGAMMGIWGKAKKFGKKVKNGLKSGLQVQRCSMESEYDKFMRLGQEQLQGASPNYDSAKQYFDMALEIAESSDTTYVQGKILECQNAIDAKNLKAEGDTALQAVPTDFNLKTDPNDKTKYLPPATSVEFADRISLSVIQNSKAYSYFQKAVMSDPAYTDKNAELATRMLLRDVQNNKIVTDISIYANRANQQGTVELHMETKFNPADQTAVSTDLGGGEQYAAAQGNRGIRWGPESAFDQHNTTFGSWAMGNVFYPYAGRTPTTADSTAQAQYAKQNPAQPVLTTTSPKPEVDRIVNPLTYTNSKQEYDNKKALYKQDPVNNPDPGKEPEMPGTMNCYTVILFGSVESGIVTESNMNNFYRKFSQESGDAFTKYIDNVPSVKQQLDAIQNGIMGDQKMKDEAKAKVRRDASMNPVITLPFIESSSILEDHLRGTDGPKYQIDRAHPGEGALPLRGDLVVFNTAGDHIAIATGETREVKGEQIPVVISLWNKPNNNYYLQIVTIDQLDDKREKNTYFFSPQWTEVK